LEIMIEIDPVVTFWDILHRDAARPLRKCNLFGGGSQNVFFWTKSKICQPYFVTEPTTKKQAKTTWQGGREIRLGL